MSNSESEHTVEVAVTVKLIGVIGCSASGKSTAAHLLASRLNSPLHPVSTDSFFDAACEALGTYEDHRCIDYANVVRWMTALTSAVPVVRVPSAVMIADAAAGGLAWQRTVQRAWLSQMRGCLPEAEKYSRQEFSERGSEARKSPPPAVTEDAADDASLGAHEAEDAQRREQHISASPPLSPPSRSASSSSDSAPRLTVYVVWEGFTLLCSRHVNSCIDVAVHVECDGETACLRRFFRSPRRHLVQHAVQSTAAGVDAAVVSRVVRQVYRPRIEQMWAVRAEAWRRTSLCDAVERELREEGLLGEDGAGVLASPAPNKDGDMGACARAALRLVSADAFDPPRPQNVANLPAASSLGVTSESTHDGRDSSARSAALSTSAPSAVCWTPAGVPTRAFQQFWEAEFDQWLSHTAQRCGRPSALSFASLTHSPCRTSAGRGAAADASPDLCDDNDKQDGEEAEDGAAYVHRVLGARGWQALLQRHGAAASATDEAAEAEALLAQVGRTEAEAGPRVAAALAPYYYEFRYWFFFEVLYYTRLLEPLQLHRLQRRSVMGASPGKELATSGMCTPRSVTRPWWTLHNGRAVHGPDSAALLGQVDAVVASIMALA